MPVWAVIPIQYATFTELSLTISGVSYSLPRIMIALFDPLKNGFGGKRKDLTPWANRPQRNTPTSHHRKPMMNLSLNHIHHNFLKSELLGTRCG